MAEKVPALGATHGNDHEGNDDCGEEGVRCKDSEVDWTRDSLPCEARHAVMRVIDNVRNQEQHRSDQR